MDRVELKPSELAADIDKVLGVMLVSGDSVLFLADARKKLKILYTALKAQEEANEAKVVSENG